MIPQPPPGAVLDAFTLGPDLDQPWLCRSYTCLFGGYWIRAFNTITRQWVTAVSDKYLDAADALRAKVRQLA